MDEKLIRAVMAVVAYFISSDSTSASSASGYSVSSSSFSLSSERNQLLVGGKYFDITMGNSTIDIKQGSTKVADLQRSGAKNFRSAYDFHNNKNYSNVSVSGRNVTFDSERVSVS